MVSVGSLYGLLVGQDILLFILPAILIARWKSKQTAAWLQLSPVPQWLKREHMWVAVLGMVVLQPGINLLADLNSRISLPTFMADIELWMQKMEEANAATTNLLLSGEEPWQILANFLVVGVLAAFSEELLFRGALQSWFREHMSRTMAIWVVAILFSLMHLQFYGFIPRMLMGALFGYTLVWTGFLYVPMVLHMTNNVLVVLLSFLVRNNEGAKASVEAFGTGDTWGIGLISLVVGCWLFYRFYQICKKYRA